MYAKRAISHPSRVRIVAYLAELHGVSVEHFLYVVAKRKEFRKARFYRQRSRRRLVMGNAGAQRFKDRYAQREHAGEGELHALMREAGMTVSEFCAYTGISMGTFLRWYGHPLHRLPVAFVEQYVWAKNMAAFLASKGWDPNQWKPKGLPKTPGGYYPRTKKQGERLIKEVTAQ